MAHSEQAQPCASSEPEGKSSAATASTLGISQRKVEQARTVLDHAPEPVNEAVQAGHSLLVTTSGGPVPARYCDARDPQAAR